MIELYVATALFAVLLLAAAAIDIKTMRIPNALNGAIAIAGLGVAIWLNLPLMDAVIGAAAGYAALFLVNWAYRSVRGRDGLGLGDAKLLAGAGAWLGWAGLPFVVLIASALGIVYAAGLRIAGRGINAGDAGRPTIVKFEIVGLVKSASPVDETRKLLASTMRSGPPTRADWRMTDRAPSRRPFARLAHGGLHC